MPVSISGSSKDRSHSKTEAHSTKEARKAAFEVMVVEGLAQLSCRIFYHHWFLEGVRQDQNRYELPDHEAHTDRPNVIVFFRQFIVA